jgi:hypothetical protein
MSFPRVVRLEEVGQGNRNRYWPSRWYPHTVGNLEGDNHELDRTFRIVLHVVVSEDRVEQFRVDVKPPRLGCGDIDTLRRGRKTPGWPQSLIGSQPVQHAGRHPEPQPTGPARQPLLPPLSWLSVSEQAPHAVAQPTIDDRAE